MTDVTHAPLDLSHANGALFAALAEAQQAANTVGKDGHNGQRNYNYSTAEAMIRAAREAMAGTGLAVISTWTQQAAEPPASGDIGNQFACALVIETFVLTHADGGYITGRAEIDAIASRARPYDKAVAAATTYMHGFVLRHLLNLDRNEEPGGAVDQRGDEGFNPQRGQTRPRQQPQRQQGGWEQHASAEVKALLPEYRRLCKARAELQKANPKAQITPIGKAVREHAGKHANASLERFTADDWASVIEGLKADIVAMEAAADITGEAAAE